MSLESKIDTTSAKITALVAVSGNIPPDKRGIIYNASVEILKDSTGEYLDSLKKKLENISELPRYHPSGVYKNPDKYVRSFLKVVNSQNIEEVEEVSSSATSSDGGDILTRDELARAISNRAKIDYEEAKRDAGFVMDIVGFEDRILDNTLDAEDRQLIYILEEFGYVTPEKEETLLYDGRLWRSHYWRINKDKIKKDAKGVKDTEKLIKQKETVEFYSTLPDKIWRSKSA